jgi:hypothetical protein
VLLSK